MKQSLLVTSLTILLVRAASANPAASAQAEVLFNDAKTLMGKKQFAEACEKFDSSQKLDPALTTLLNAADCHEKNKQLATAWGLFLDAERQTRGDKANDKLHALAQTRAKKLESRLSKLTIQVDPAAAKLAGFAVTLDGQPVIAGSIGTALPMDGGHYTVKATATSSHAFETTVDLAAEGDTKVVQVPALEPEATGTTPIKTTHPDLTSHHAEPQPQPRLEPDQPTSTAAAPSHKGAIIATVAAIALGGGAITFELMGRSALDDSKKEPDPMKQDALYDKANTRHYVAQGLGIAAVGATGVAVYLWVRGGSHASDRQTMTILTPTVGPDQVGVSFSGAWR
jgi:hypothetical protein